MRRLVVGIDPGSEGAIAAVFEDSRETIIRRLPVTDLSYPRFESDEAYKNALSSVMRGNKGPRRKERDKTTFELLDKKENGFDTGAFEDVLYELEDIAADRGYCGLLVHVETPVVLKGAGLTSIRTAIHVGRSTQLLYGTLRKLRSSRKCMNFVTSSPVGWKNLYDKDGITVREKKQSIKAAHSLYKIDEEYKNNHDACEAVLLAGVIYRYGRRYIECQCT